MKRLVSMLMAVALLMRISRTWRAYQLKPAFRPSTQSINLHAIDMQAIIDGLMQRATEAITMAPQEIGERMTYSLRV